MKSRIVWRHQWRINSRLLSVAANRRGCIRLLIKHDRNRSNAMHPSIAIVPQLALYRIVRCAGLIKMFLETHSKQLQ